jgi:signal transduction histidine kinase
MLVARNVAYLGQVQSTLKYSRKLATLGRLLTGVAHEVKNPLNAMTIHLELLKQKLTGNVMTRRRAAPSPAAAAVAVPPASPAPDAAAVMQHVTVIGQEIRRLDEVVQGFLRFSRPEELVLQPVDLQALVVDVTAVIGPDAESREIAVVNACPPDLPSVNGDAAMLRQSLLNLALNACEAMPEGGSLSFGGRAVPGGLVELTVSDTGIGISDENLERIFDLYFTTREGGSGIGLSMVYRTVHLHDGTIDVSSTPGKGTTFTLTLPQA